MENNNFGKIIGQQLIKSGKFEFAGNIIDAIYSCNKCHKLFSLNCKFNNIDAIINQLEISNKLKPNNNNKNYIEQLKLFKNNKQMCIDCVNQNYFEKK